MAIGSRGTTSRQDRARCQSSQSRDNDQGSKATEKQGTRKHNAPCPRNSTKPSSLAMMHGSAWPASKLPTSHNHHNLARRRGTIVPTAAAIGRSEQIETTHGRSKALLPTGLDTTPCSAMASGDKTSAGQGKASVTRATNRPGPRASQAHQSHGHDHPELRKRPSNVSKQLFQSTRPPRQALQSASLTASRAGERHGPSRQDKRDSVFGSTRVVEGNGLGRYQQQARPRMQRKWRSVRDSAQDGNATRNSPNESNTALAPNWHRALQTRDHAPAHLTREQLPTSRHQHDPSAPPPQSGGDGTKLTGCQDSQQPDASHDTRREHLCWPRQGGCDSTHQ